jgi:predicted lipid carrier protein YhbT
MKASAAYNDQPSLKHALLEKGFRLSTIPFPMPLVNLFLGRLAKKIASGSPEIFDRLEGHHHKWFRIEITNLPFVLHLMAAPSNPQLVAFRRRSAPPVAGVISGTFLTLLGMIDGRYDGDALFFTRDLHISGDTEAVVSLRNALDGSDKNVADEAAKFFGTPGQKFLNFARKVSENVRKT